MELLVIIFVIVVLVIIVDLIRYNSSQYKAETKNSFFEVYGNKGKNGEYELVNCIEKLDGYKKVLINCYIPRPNGMTSEIDVILLHESGVYVLENKNYGGWIFGSENQTYWTETFRDGHGGSKKYKFYNPIMQNDSHIKALQQFLENDSLLSSWLRTDVQ